MQLLREQFPQVYAVAESIIKSNGKAFLVGGAVRDYLLERDLKDIDIEVHHMTQEQLEAVLKKHGIVSTVGKSFGVLRIHGINADWSLPRFDSAGRKPNVAIDPFMPLEDALRRRDLTMNAMAIDIATNTLIDPFCGERDIKNKVLRAPDTDLFKEDPLRFFRVMQFISRFEMMPDQKLEDVCKSIDISTVSRERIEEEFKKMLLLSRRPSLGIRWLQSIGRLREIMPELADTVSIEQNPVWHPEGNVFEHSMQTLDAAAPIAATYDSEFKKLVLLYAALCHDLGKVTTTTHINGVIKSIGHEQESKRFATTMLKRITQNNDLIAMVANLVLYHMMPLQFVKGNARLSAYKRLARKLHKAVSISFLADLSCADKRGRNGESHEPLTGDMPDLLMFIERAQKADVFNAPEEALVSGADLMGSVKPGPAMGRMLEKAYDIQINEGVTDKKELLRRIIRK